MRSYARNVSSQASIPTLISDLSFGDNSLSETTMHQYINALKSIYVIEDLQAWNPNIRSKAAIRTNPTRHFVDPSIATFF